MEDSPLSGLRADGTVQEETVAADTDAGKWRLSINLEEYKLYDLKFCEKKVLTHFNNNNSYNL